MARQKSEFLSALGILFEIFRLLVNDILAAGGSDEDIRRIGTDSSLREKLVEVVLAGKKVVFQTWKTVRIGTGLKTADDFRKALKQGKFRISRWGNDILDKLDKVTGSCKAEEIQLVRVTNAELGFPDGARVEDTFRRAQELDLKLCPAEIGPQLRLQYTDQPMGEWLLVAMDPVSDSGGDLNVFYVVRNEYGTWLDGIFGYPKGVWSGHTTWLFRN